MQNRLKSFARDDEQWHDLEVERGRRWVFAVAEPQYQDLSAQVRAGGQWRIRLKERNLGFEWLVWDEEFWVPDRFVRHEALPHWSKVTEQNGSRWVELMAALTSWGADSPYSMAFFRIAKTLGFLDFPVPGR
jgi:hypothetical protein